MSPMNNRRMTPTQEPGILDFAPGAAAAYSLRNLSLSYTGPVVTVRRSTDDAEADFTASEVSDGTLAGWAGADGFVKQWWDQSGNARHATQATAGYQPQIVDSGVLVTEGGKAAVRFDGVDDSLGLQVHAVRLSQNNASVFVVSSLNTLSANKYLIVEADSVSPYSSNFIFGGNITSGEALWVNGSTFGIRRLGLSASSFTYDGTVFRCFLDGIQQGASGAATVNVEAGSGTVIGAAGNASLHFFEGSVSEIVIYRENQLLMIDRITANQMWYY